MSNESSRTYLPGPKTARRYGVSDRTISRWEADLKLGFPQPMIVNGRKFHPLDELEAWERSRAAPSAQKKAA